MTEIPPVQPQGLLYQIPPRNSSPTPPTGRPAEGLYGPVRSFSLSFHTHITFNANFPFNSDHPSPLKLELSTEMPRLRHLRSTRARPLLMDKRR